jgi:hypothetical protein
LSSLHQNPEDDENDRAENSDSNENEKERYRRQIMTRKIRQIHREADYELGLIDKLNERAHRELKKKQNSTTTSASSSSIYLSLVN